jgi:hypothetical protein
MLQKQLTIHDWQLELKIELRSRKDNRHGKVWYEWIKPLLLYEI